MAQNKVNTRDKLIETATSLMWQSSYYQVSVDQICKAADVQKGSFYHYFETKADLACEVMEDHYKMYKPLLDDAFSPSRNPVERFKQFSNIAFNVQQETTKEYGCVCGALFVTLGLEMAGKEECEVSQKAQEILSRYIRYYENALRDMVAEGYFQEDIDIKIIAVNIHAFIMGQLIMARIYNSLEILRHDLEKGILSIAGIDEDL